MIYEYIKGIVSIVGCRVVRDSLVIGCYHLLSQLTVPCH